MVAARLSSAALTGIAAVGFLAMFALGYLVHDWLLPRTLLALAWVSVFATLAWMRLDETAREAHKFAWFYGAGLALILALLALVALIMTPDAWSALEPRLIGFAPAVVNMPPALSGFVGGLMLCAIVQCVGYGVVWSVWWLRRR